MEPYPKYKPSGIDWLGEIPENWEVTRIDGVADLSKKNISKSDLENEKEVLHISIPSVQKTGGGLLENGDSIDSNKIILEDGELLVSKLNPRKDTVIVVEKPEEEILTVASTEFVPILPKQEHSLRFFYYLYKSHGVREYICSHVESATKSHQRANPAVIYKLWVSLPKKEEQTTIARFLDQKTSEIDHLMAQKQALIETLEEEKQAVINQAVTKGLNPDAPMKDSGLPWVGEIPEHWEVKKLKYIIKRLDSGVSVNSTDYPASENELGVLKTSCVYTFSFRPEENKKILEKEIDRASCPVQRGAIIISRMNTPDLVGASGYVDKEYPNLFLPDRLWQTVFFEDLELNSRWLSQILASTLFHSWLSSYATGTSPSMKNISKDDLLNQAIPFPKMMEQESISDRILEESHRIESAVNSIKKEITLIQEYKTALISEAVTGKIDVRNFDKI